MGASTERKQIRKKALASRNLGFSSSTANRAKAMMSTSMPNSLKNTGRKSISYVLSGETVKYNIPKKAAKQLMPPAIRKRKRQRCQRNHQKQMNAPNAYPGNR